MLAKFYIIFNLSPHPFPLCFCFAFFSIWLLNLSLNFFLSKVGPSILFIYGLVSIHFQLCFYYMNPFFNWDWLHARLKSYYKARSYKKKKHKKIKAYRNSVCKKPTVRRFLLTLTLNVIYIIGQRKAFYRQRIAESSCMRKETVEVDILVTSKNGDRKIMQTMTIMSRLPSRIRKWN